MEGIGRIEQVCGPRIAEDEAQNEEVHLHNLSDAPIPLAGWKIGDSTGTAFWVLDASDGTVLPGAIIVVRRKGRGMILNNTGDTITLFDPAKTDPVDTKSYGHAKSGQVITF